MPRRTMLPPNLTRHVHETRRLIAENEGTVLPPWFRLTSDERASVERDMEIFRRAITRAEEEQDIVAAYNASVPAQPQYNGETAAPTVENCGCPGCSTIAALIELIRQAQRLEAALGGDSDGSGRGYSVFALASTAPGDEELERVRKATREAIGKWGAAGKPLKATSPATMWSFEGGEPQPLSRDYLRRLQERILRAPYQSSFPFLITGIRTTQPPTVDNA